MSDCKEIGIRIFEIVASQMSSSGAILKLDVISNLMFNFENVKRKTNRHKRSSLSSIVVKSLHEECKKRRRRKTKARKILTL